MCQINGPNCTGVATSVDHIVPVFRGGTDDLANLRAACDNCHREKTGRELASRRRTSKRPTEQHPGIA